MPTISKCQATEKLASLIEKARPAALAEIYGEIFPANPAVAQPSAADLARHVRNGLQGEEIVDLWNVVIPADHNVWYNEEDDAIHYNEEAIGYVD